MWITCFWSKAGFDYLVDEVREVGIDATYDEIPLTLDRELWFKKILEGTTSGRFDGWACVWAGRAVTRAGARVAAGVLNIILE